MLYPSVWTGYYDKLSVFNAVPLLKKAGFDYGELAFNHAEELVDRGTAPQLRSLLEDEGYTLLQGHLTFTGGLCKPEVLDTVKRELELFQQLGIRNAVLHFNGGKELPPQERFDRRVACVRELQACVRGSELYLCLENLGSEPETHTAQRLLHILEAVGGENLGICLDTGHLHLVNGRGEAQQTQREFILAAGKHLRALHITENNGKNDVHQMPYSARTGIDWPQVVEALREVGYNGLFNLEILGERNAPDPIKTAKLGFIREMLSLMLA